MLIINDNNWQEHVDISHARTGGVSGVMPRRTVYGSDGAAECGLIVGEEVMRPFPESEWPDRIQAMTGRFVGDVMVNNRVPCKDQGNLGYCWAHSLASCVEVNRLTSGQGYTELAPESLGGDVGWRNRGNYLDGAIEYAREHGICRREFVEPNNIRPGTYEPGWELDAKRFRPMEWFDLDGKNRWPMTVTALLCGLPVYVGYDWWSHALIVVGLKIIDGEVCLVLRNSWGSGYGDDGYFVLKGRKKYPSYGCFAPRSTTFSPVV